MKFSASEIAKILNGEIDGDSSIVTTSLDKIEEATKDSITFLSNKKYTPWIYKTKASIVVVNKKFSPLKKISSTLIRVEDPYTSFVKLLHKFSDKTIKNIGIHNSIVLPKSCKTGKNISIGAFTFLGNNVEFGDNVKIFNNVSIGDNVKIGENSIIYPGATLYKNSIIGKNCILHSNSVIGSDGFGYAPDSSGNFVKIPHIGNVVIEDNVEVGASSTIDRATIGSTLIKKGVKIDNLVQIAHNAIIGENTVIAALAGIAGSSKTGKNCQIGGSGGLSGHVTIGDNVKIQGCSAVWKDAKDNSVLRGTPAFNERDFNRSYIHFKNLDKYVKDIENLKKNNDSSN